jgi:AbiTii
VGRRDSKLIDQIEQGALDSKVPLADTLRKCVALGGQTKSAELRDWASRELNGYGRDDELPEWRTVPAQILMDFTNARFHVKGRQISVWDLPEFARDNVKEEVSFRGGVGELEAVIRQADEGTVRIGLPGGSDLVAYMNLMNDTPYQSIERIYYAIGTASVHGILDRVRTLLTALVAEMRHGMPDDAAVPSEEVATNAAHYVITGKRNKVIINNAQSGGEGTSGIGPESEREPESPRWKRWARFGSGLVGIATVLALVVAWLQYKATP